MALLQVPSGAWPTMITPFQKDTNGRLVIDYRNVDELIAWFLHHGVAGIFSVCLSSEMYHLSNEERLQLARHVVDKTKGRVPIVATGSFGATLGEIATFVHEMYKTGVAAVVIAVSQLCTEQESEEVWIQRTKELLQKTHPVPLGLYECPLPYHRLLSPGALDWAASTGRFFFHKDTCCARGPIAAKLAAVQKYPNFKFFNANAATLLYSLEHGAAGFSGIAANVYPALHVWLCGHWRTADPTLARQVQRFLTIAEAAVAHKYPTGAKAYLAQYSRFEGLQPLCRNQDVKLTEEELIRLADLKEEVELLVARVLQTCGN